MTCRECGDKPQNPAKDFTKAVIEINNPEKLTFLRKVVIPASLGTEEDVPPTIGKYRNVLLQYEMNNHLYIYSSDGIPTAVDANIPQEILDRISTLESDVDLLEIGLAKETEDREKADGVLQQEIDDIKNSPDVVDIVATYSDLMAYDTSSLGDNDVIRVLRDETHDGQSAYYRWDKPHSTWTFIGTVGDYYTKQQVDTLLDGKQDELTPGENISIVDESGDLVISATDTTYSAGSGLDLTGTTFSVDTNTIATKQYVDTSPAFKPFPASVNTTGTTQQFLNSVLALDTEVGTAYLGTVSLSDMPAGLMQEEVEVYVYSDYVVYAVMRSTDVAPYEWWCASYNYGGWRASDTNTTYSAGSGLNLVGTTFSVDTSTIATQADLDAKQNVLTAGDNITIQDESGDLVISATDTTYTAGDGIDIIDGVISATSSGPTVVQTTGTSTTSVMSQNAVSGMVWTNPSTKNSIRIGLGNGGGYRSVVITPDGGFVNSNAQTTVAIGPQVTIGSGIENGVAIGNAAQVSGSSSIAIGAGAEALNSQAIALGRKAKATVKGQFDISTLASVNTDGYNNSQYRLLTGLYDAQNDHDAVTLGQMNTALSGKQDELVAGNGIAIQDESGALVISATGAQIATINAQDWSDLWQ